ncbi:hypothetical protein DaDZ19_11010 [Dickeya ananatis]
MAKKDATQRTGDKPHAKGGERRQHRRYRADIGKEQFAKYQCARQSVEQEIVKLDGVANPTGDHHTTNVGFVVHRLVLG